MLGLTGEEEFQEKSKGNPVSVKDIPGPSPALSASCALGSHPIHAWATPVPHLLNFIAQCFPDPSLLSFPFLSIRLSHAVHAECSSGGLILS